MAGFSINRRASVGLLVLITIIWGSTFPILKVCVGSISPQAILLYRFGISSILLLPFLLKVKKNLLIHGLILGVILFVAFASQTIGLQFTSASRTAFITGTSVVMVPLIEMFLRRHSPGPIPGIGAVVACVGVALLCGDSGGGITVGDLWVGLCALTYAIYIICISRWTGKHPVMPLTAVQMITVAILAAIWMLIDPGSCGFMPFDSSLTVIGIVYLAVFATVGTTILQIVAQRKVSSTVTAIVFSAEPLFGALFSMMFINEVLGIKGVIGGLLIVGAILIAQIPAARGRRRLHPTCGERVEPGPEIAPAKKQGPNAEAQGAKTVGPWGLKNATIPWPPSRFSLVHGFVVLGRPLAEPAGQPVLFTFIVSCDLMRPDNRFVVKD